MTRSILLTALSAVALSACGGPRPQAGGPAPVGVYTSASDCADSQKLDMAQCNELIQKALDEHRQTAKTYISLRLCEAGEGADHCERTEENSYRRSLQAFLITFSDPPAVQGLYAGADPTQPAFQTIDKNRTVLAIDETLMFSKSARFVAEGNKK